MTKASQNMLLPIRKHIQHSETPDASGLWLCGTFNVIHGCNQFVWHHRASLEDPVSGSLAVSQQRAEGNADTLSMGPQCRIRALFVAHGEPIEATTFCYPPIGVA
jgi:hypothetical protein